MSLLRAAAVFATGVVLVIACKDQRADACTVDKDCGPGSYCVSGYCAEPSGNGDGGADSEVVTQCVATGSMCSVDNDCCAPPCTGFRCAGTGTGTSGRTSSGSAGTSGSSGTSGTSGTSSSGGSCADIYGLCSTDTDCCTGLSCDATNTCR